MTRIIKHRRIVDDPWLLLGDDQDAPHRIIELWMKNKNTGTAPGPRQPAGEAGLILSWADWRQHGPALVARGRSIGLWLEPDAEAEDLLPHLSGLPLIAVRFPSFTDGRGYSLARSLRRLGFGGELRAVGDILQDQLFFLEQCGFNAFALRPDQDPLQALVSFQAYSTLPGAKRRSATVQETQ